MTPKDSLFRLIKSLDSNEKRYFRLRQLHSGNKSYLRVFDEIARMKVYNENMLKEKFTGEIFIKQFTFTKNYLFNSILDSLVNYNHSSSIDVSLRFELSKLKVLFNKAMYSDYFDSIRRLKEKAYKYERFVIILEVIALERLYINVSKLKRKSHSDVYKEEKQLLQKIENISLYSNLINKVFSMFREEGVSRSKETVEKLKNIKLNPLVKNPKNALSVKSYEYYLHLNQLISQIDGNLDIEFKFALKRYELSSEYPRIFEDNLISIRQEALVKLIILSANIGRTDLLNEYLLDLNSLKEKGESLDGYVILFLDMYTRIESKEFRFDNKLFESIVNEIQVSRGEMEKDFYLMFVYKFCEWLLLCGKPDYSLRHVNQLLSDPLLKNREDLKSFSAILNVMIHIELNNFMLVESLCISIKKSLRKKSKLYTFENEFINFANRLSRLHLPKEVSDEKKFFAKKLSDLSKSGDKFIQNALRYLKILDWLNKQYSR